MYNYKKITILTNKNSKAYLKKDFVVVVVVLVVVVLPLLLPLAILLQAVVSVLVGRCVSVVLAHWLVRLALQLFSQPNLLSLLSYGKLRSSPNNICSLSRLSIRSHV
jgi:hypothetical protein